LWKLWETLSGENRLASLPYPIPSAHRLHYSHAQLPQRVARLFIQQLAPGQQLYSARDDQVIFVSFFFRPATLQMLAVALATSALRALQAKKINSPKFHRIISHGVYLWRFKAQTCKPFKKTP
jgi:hypothetical protein